MSASTADARTDASRLILFVTGDSPRSRRARANLENALKDCPADPGLQEEVDVLKEPEKLVEYGIFATPALLYIQSDSGTTCLYGDLSDKLKLREFLQ